MSGIDQIGKSKLLQRSEAYHQAVEALEKKEGFADSSSLSRMKEGFEEKLFSYGETVQQYNQASQIILAEAKVLQEQIDTLKKRAQAFEKASDQIKQDMHQAMQRHELTHLENAHVSIKLRKKPNRVESDQPKPDLQVWCETLADTVNLSLSAIKNRNPEERDQEINQVQHVLDQYRKIEANFPYYRFKVELDKAFVQEELKAGKTIEGMQFTRDEYAIIVK